MTHPSGALIDVVYLDYNATTPIDPAVLDAMLPFLTDRFGNAASSHAVGALAATAVRQARDQVAALLGGNAGEVAFTSGSTESINIALQGYAETVGGPARARLVVAATEHKAVLDTAHWLAAHGAELVVVPVDGGGVIDLPALAAALQPGPALVSVMAANNETGTLGAVADVAALTHAHGGVLHCDASQYAGKLPLDVRAWDVDLLSMTAHKLYGPKGTGALWVRSGLANRPAPLLHGGGHEHGLRSGTLNVPGIVGLGAACAVAQAALPAEADRLRELRDTLHDLLADGVGGLELNGDLDLRLPGTLNVRIPEAPSDVVMAAAPGVAVSAGAACNAADVAPSYVLTAMGRSAVQARESLRISVGRFTTYDDVHQAAALLSEAVARARRRG
jgi:cysteine desulfurase